MVDQKQIMLPESRILVLDIPEKASLDVLPEQIRLAGTSQFNGILVPFYREGYSFYPSRAAREQNLPAIKPDLRKKPDLFHQIFDQAFVSSLSVWAYIDPLRLGNKIRFPFRPFFKTRKKWISLNKMRKPFPIGLSEKDSFVCLYNEDVRRFVTEIAVEIAEKFPIQGLILDLSRYPHFSNNADTMSCFCDYCVKQIREELSLDLQKILLEPNDSAFRCWKRWKNNRLFSFVEYVSSRVGKARSGIPFFTIVPGALGNLHETGVENRGEPSVWASEGLVSSLVTRYQKESPARFFDKVDKDLSYLPDDILLTPFLMVDNLAELSDCIEPLRDLPLSGFLLKLADPLTDGDAGKLSQGLFRNPSLEPLSDVFASIRSLIRFILDSSDRHSALNSFLTEIHSYIQNEQNVTLEKNLSILEDLRTIEQKFKSGDLDAGFLPASALRNISLIKKLFRTSIKMSR
ncbi:family 10 glycosylhydrolase [Candidatus Sumerlaeota bacterium]|nr:family 10 glycosylhydrolase [Candidatus Sumerlaeota bacterium]